MTSFPQREHGIANIRYAKSEYMLSEHEPLMLILVQQMELINECSIRFAEDKDFRLLASILRNIVVFSR